jgi:hypothetical protein
MHVSQPRCGHPRTTLPALPVNGREEQGGKNQDSMEDEMKANSLSRFAQLTLLGLLAVFSPIASAQSVQGSFDLPVAVHWGIADLPAGHYNFTMDKMGSPYTLRVTSEQKSAAIMASGGAELSTPDSPSAAHLKQKIVLVETRKGWAVSTLELPDLGVVLHYRTATPSGELLSKNSQTRPSPSNGR